MITREGINYMNILEKMWRHWPGQTAGTEFTSIVVKITYSFCTTKDTPLPPDVL